MACFAVVARVPGALGNCPSVPNAAKPGCPAAQKLSLGKGPRVLGAPARGPCAYHLTASPSRARYFGSGDHSVTQSAPGAQRLEVVTRLSLSHRWGTGWGTVSGCLWSPVLA